MRTSRSLFRHFVVLMAVVMAATSLLAAPRRIVVGITEGKSPGSGLRDHDSFIKHLKASSEFAFDVKVFANYDELYAAFKAKQLDLAAIGPVKYVQARHETGAIPIVAEGSMQKSVLVIPMSSKLKSVEELKGKRFAFGYQDSTSTHLMPLLVLSKHHIKEKDLGKALFVGTQQEKVIEAVTSGQADAGAVAESVYEANKGRVKLLEYSEPFPGPPVIGQKSIDAPTLQKLKGYLLAYKPSTPEQQKQRFGRGVTAVTDADYNKIRFLVKVVLKRTYV
jgi:phosphonate transport system substrate-binding protein